jgi:hypothetical protein
MDYTKSWDHLNSIVEQLNDKGYGTKQLQDPLLEQIKVALLAFKQQLEESTNGKIFNVIRNIFLTSGLDLYNKFPMVVLGSIQFNKGFSLGRSTVLDWDDPIGSQWSLDCDYCFFPLTVDIINETNNISIKITSSQLFDHKIINKINFYGKGGGFFPWLNGVIKEQLEIVVNNLNVGQGRFVWEPGDFLWTSLENFNPWIEKLLYHYWAPATQRFFQLQLDDFGTTNEIILRIQGHYNPDIQWETNYFYGINYFPQESLPIHKDPSNYYGIPILNNGQKIQKITQVKGQEVIESYQKNHESFYYDFIDNDKIFIQLSPSLMAQSVGEYFTVSGYFINVKPPISNNILYNNNDGSIEKITGLQLITPQRQENLESVLIAIGGQYVNNMTIQPNVKFIENLWKNIKNVGKILGSIHDDEIFNITITTEKYDIVPQVFFHNNRNQILDTHCWWISINKKNFNNIIDLYLNGILDYYGIQYRVILT